MQRLDRLKVEHARVVDKIWSMDGASLTQIRALSKRYQQWAFATARGIANEGQN